MNEASKADIDQAIFSYTKKASKSGQKVRGKHLKAHLLKSLIGCLPSVGRKDTPAWRAEENANRSCKRLKKAGILTYDGKKGWLISQRIPPPHIIEKAKRATPGPWTTNCAGEIFADIKEGKGIRIGHFQGCAKDGEAVCALHNWIISTL